jgi:hypothetical protein
MSTTNLIRGNDDRAFPGLSTYQLSTIERQRLAEGLRHFQTFADDQFPSDVACQRLLAEIVADGILPQAAPGLNRVIEMARKDIVDCIYVTNLPIEKSIASLLLLTIGSAIGRIFNYASQISNELVMEVSSDRGASIPRGEFDWHTEGAWIPRDHRVEWICLLGLDNTPGTFAAYAPIRSVEQTLSARTRTWLYSKSACFHGPNDFTTDASEPSLPRAVLTRSPLGHIEIVWPGFAVHPARPDDTAYVDALTELSAEFNRENFQVSLDKGCLLAFNNCRGVYMHAPAGSDAYHLFYKTYVRQSLQALQQATGKNGPIFSLVNTVAQRNLSDRWRSSHDVRDDAQSRAVIGELTRRCTIQG